jgi:hypothetical protein
VSHVLLLPRRNDGFVFVLFLPRRDDGGGGIVPNRGDDGGGVKAAREGLGLAGGLLGYGVWRLGCAKAFDFRPVAETKGMPICSPRGSALALGFRNLSRPVLGSS